MIFLACSCGLGHGKTDPDSHRYIDGDRLGRLLSDWYLFQGMFSAEKRAASIPFWTRMDLDNNLYGGESIEFPGWREQKQALLHWLEGHTLSTKYGSFFVL